jgi:hypothetical protein
MKRHETTVKSSINMGSVMASMVLVMMQRLKKVEFRTITGVIMTVIVVVNISGDSVASRNFLLHCHFVNEVLT